MRDFTREEIDHIFDVAEKMEPISSGRTKIDLLKDKISGGPFLSGKHSDTVKASRLPCSAWVDQ